MDGKDGLGSWSRSLSICPKKITRPFFQSSIDLIFPFNVNRRRERGLIDMRGENVKWSVKQLFKKSSEKKVDKVRREEVFKKHHIRIPPTKPKVCPLHLHSFSRG